MESERTREERLASETPESEQTMTERAGGTPFSARESPAPGMRIENLSAYYGTFKAITDVSIGIQTNKVTAIIGPSGCGKSTFIRCRTGCTR